MEITSFEYNSKNHIYKHVLLYTFLFMAIYRITRAPAGNHLELNQLQLVIDYFSAFQARLLRILDDVMMMMMLWTEWNRRTNKTDMHADEVTPLFQ